MIPSRELSVETIEKIIKIIFWERKSKWSVMKYADWSSELPVSKIWFNFNQNGKAIKEKQMGRPVKYIHTLE